SARRLQRFFPGFLVLGFMSRWLWTATLMALADAVIGPRTSDSVLPFVMPLLPVCGVLSVFYERRAALVLAPAEPAPAGDGRVKFDFRTPQAWWLVHQFANLLVLAPWVGYWGSLTRGYYPPFGKLAF